MTHKKEKNKRRIYKKTALRFYSFVAENKRSEPKVIKRRLRARGESVEIALGILTDKGYLKERSYSDIGVSYYYPSDKKKLCIMILSHGVSHMVITTPALQILEHFKYLYFTDLLPDENLHIFIKNAYKFLSEYSIESPQDSVYFFCPKIKDDSSSTPTHYFKELSLLELQSYISERMKAKDAFIYFYEHEFLGFEIKSELLLSLIKEILYSEI